MKDNNQNELKENENINVSDDTEEIAYDISDEVAPEPEYVTREINLDDLYDGAINNTIVIDPVTNNEVLLSNKKPNYTLLGVIVAIVILLVLYYVNNKSDLGRTTKNVEPKTTTTMNVKKEENENGTLTCTYSSKSDAESQSVTFVANYENSNITDTNFNYVVMSNIDNLSAVVEDLRTQYETFFINNASVNGNNVSYEKNDKGFTFNVETNYSKSDFNGLVMSEGQTILFVKPSTDDSVESLQKAYIDKGFNCSLTNSSKEE